MHIYVSKSARNLGLSGLKYFEEAGSSDKQSGWPIYWNAEVTDVVRQTLFNAWVPGRYDCNIKSVIFSHQRLFILNYPFQIALR